MVATQREIKQRRLLEQAERLFAGKGFKAVTMDEIAAAAGISKMTIYNRYQSKENLFLEVNLHLISRFNQEAKKAVWKETCTLDRLRVYFELGQQTAQLISPAYLKDIYDMPYLIEEIANYKKETTLAILGDILKEGSLCGEVQETDLQFVMQLLNVLTAGMRQLMPQMDGHQMLAFNRRLFEFIQRGLLTHTLEQG